MIDLHCHVLPGIDDGPDDLEGTLALARAAAADGTRTIVATPHVSWTYPHVLGALIDEKVAEANEALTAAGIAMTVLAGGEVAHTRALDLPDPDLAAVRLGDTDWLLLECPLAMGVGFETFAVSLMARGHRVVLAHPERSPVFHADPDLLGRLVRAGAVAQATVGALEGRFGRVVRAQVVAMGRAGLLHNLATDAHAATGSRAPRLCSALLEVGVPAEVIAYCCDAAPRALLAGDTPPPPPRWVPAGEPEGQRRRFGFGRRRAA